MAAKLDMRFRRLAPFTLKLSLFALLGVTALGQTTSEAAAGSLYDVA
jgi:hypothetical protein